MSYVNNSHGQPARVTNSKFPHQNVQIDPRRADPDGGQEAPPALHPDRRLPDAPGRLPVVRSRREGPVVRAGDAGEGGLGVRPPARGEGGGRDLQLRGQGLREAPVRGRALRGVRGTADVHAFLAPDCLIEASLRLAFVWRKR